MFQWGGGIVLTGMRMLGAMAMTAVVVLGQFAPVEVTVTNGTGVTGPSTYFNVAADFNGDGRVDLVAPDNRVFDNSFGFSLLPSRPQGGYGAVVSMAGLMQVSNLAAADVNGDGKMDVVMVGASGVGLVLGNGNGTFGGLRMLGAPVSPAAGANLVVRDVNGDGRVDVLVPGAGGMAVALGNGDGSFGAWRTYATTFTTVYVMVGDFTGDGKLDAIATVNSLTAANLFVGNGDGTFAAAVPTAAIPFGAVAEDVNQDGRLDVVMQTAQPRQDGSNFAITVLLGQGNGQFLQYSNHVFAQPFSGIVVADFDGDGQKDVATYLTGNGMMTVLRGVGGAFGGVLYQAPVANGPFALMGADVDANGSPDVVVSSYPQVAVFRNVRGVPPLLAQMTLSASAVIGGAERVTGTLVLGGPAPAGGIEVVVTTTDVAASVVGTGRVVIAAGASSASFELATTAVMEARNVTVEAVAAGVKQRAGLTVVPGVVLMDFTVSPSSQYGNLTSTATVTLNGPAASSTVVTILTADPALVGAPATIAVPAGQTSVSFPVVLKPVVSNTFVRMAALFENVTRQSGVTVLPAGDVVGVAKSLYVAKSFELRLDATSTNATATLTVLNAATGAVIGTLRNGGGGKYSGTFTVNLGNAPRVTVLSSLGGISTIAVPLK